MLNLTTVRAILGVFNAGALLAFRNAVVRAFGKSAGNWYVLLQASQFHVIYYASRTLPNTFAFGLSKCTPFIRATTADNVTATIAIRSYLLANLYGPNHAWGSRHSRLCLYLMTFAAVVFRSEIAILLAMHTICLFLRGRAPVAQTIVPAGFAGAALGLAITVSIDSFFWQQLPLWPELNGFYYNTILGKSSEWGVSRWDHYFVSAIPKLMLNPLAEMLCIPIAVKTHATRSRSAALLAPALMFVAVYSLLPHKEWRFIIYIIPPLTAVAAAGASWIWTRRAKSFLYGLCSLALVLSVMASFLASSLLLGISSLNYPGGEALTRLHGLVGANSTEMVKVHLDNLSCQSGVTRFLQLPTSDTARAFDGGTQALTIWSYDKTENMRDLLDPEFWSRFDFALVESPARVPGKWRVVDVVYGFAGVKILKPGDPGRDAQDLELQMRDGREVHARRPQGNYDALWYRRLLLLEGFARQKITRGWWVGVRMEPKIWILKQEKD